MSMLGSITDIIQTLLTSMLVLIIAISVIMPLWAYNKVKQKKEESINNFQDNTMDIQGENNPITEGERNTIVGMSKIIKAIFTIIMIILILYPIIVIMSIFNR